MADHLVLGALKTRQSARFVVPQEFKLRHGTLPAKMMRQPAIKQMPQARSNERTV
jgi:hypothetical protein